MLKHCLKLFSSHVLASIWMCYCLPRVGARACICGLEKPHHVGAVVHATSSDWLKYMFIVTYELQRRPLLFHDLRIRCHYPKLQDMLDRCQMQGSESIAAHSFTHIRRDIQAWTFRQWPPASRCSLAGMQVQASTCTSHNICGTLPVGTIGIWSKLVHLIWFQSAMRKCWVKAN